MQSDGEEDEFVDYSNTKDLELYKKDKIHCSKVSKDLENEVEMYFDQFEEEKSNFQRDTIK